MSFQPETLVLFSNWTAPWFDMYWSSTGSADTDQLTHATMNENYIESTIGSAAVIGENHKLQLTERAE
jgi:hypothetical protein